MKVYLGIDTSCYTTSLCLLDEQAAVLADERRILTLAVGNGISTCAKFTGVNGKNRILCGGQYGMRRRRNG